nr:hypothetical protein [Tanacetum cinerariifolium]
MSQLLIKVGDEAVHNVWGDRMEMVATTASSLEAKQDSDISLFPTMLVLGQIDQGVESIVPVKSHQTPTNAPSASQPPTSTPSMRPTHNAAEPATMPHDSHLLKTKLTYGAAYTKLILRVKKLEHKVKKSQHRRKARARKTSADTEILLDQEEPTELVEDLGSVEKGEKQLVLSFLKDVEKAKQLLEAITEADSAHDIDWNDPAVLRYHALQNKSFPVAEVKKNMCKNYAQNVKNQSKTGQYQTQDWKSTPKAGSTSSFSQAIKP